MKSEERHRLQESELEKLGRHARSFWDSFLKDYAKIALVAVFIALVIGVGLTWYFVSSANARAEQWNEVISASFDQDPSQSLVQLEGVATNYPDDPAGQWAALLQAEAALSDGIRSSRTNRPTAVDELLRARDSFASLANADSEILQERRAFGMARTLEALAGVDVSKDDKGQNVKGVEDALTAYEKFVEQYPDSIFAAMAENRIRALKNPQTQDFYAWYREQYPRPEDRRGPEDGPSPPGGGSGLPAGHPPLSPGQMPPFSPGQMPPSSPGQAAPFPPGLSTNPGSPGGQTTEESLIQQLESLNKGETSLGETQESGQPASAEKPLSGEGPSLVPPNAPNAPKAPKDETKPTDKPGPPTPDETNDVKPAPAPNEKPSETPSNESTPK